MNSNIVETRLNRVHYKNGRQVRDCQVYCPSNARIMPSYISPGRLRPEIEFNIECVKSEIKPRITSIHSFGLMYQVLNLNDFKTLCECQTFIAQIPLNGYLPTMQYPFSTIGNWVTPPIRFRRKPITRLKNVSVSSKIVKPSQIPMRRDWAKLRRGEFRESIFYALYFNPSKYKSDVSAFVSAYNISNSPT